MLDEPSEGIMPVLVDEMFALFARMRDNGATILLVEQNVSLALGDRAYVLDGGMGGASRPGRRPSDGRGDSGVLLLGLAQFSHVCCNAAHTRCAEAGMSRWGVSETWDGLYHVALKPRPVWKS